MRTDKDVLNYFGDTLYIEYAAEETLLRKTISLLTMLPETCLVRVEAGTRSGISDILVCYHGKFVAIELKDNSGTASKQQIQFIEKVFKAGGYGAVCRTLNEVYEALQAAQ